MKRIIAIAVALTMTVSCLADGKVIPASELPEAARSFISNHFPNHKVLQAEKEFHEYEVLLDGAVKLEFNHKGQWKKVDCEHGAEAVPAAVIPAAVAQYVKASYPTATVTSISRDRRDIEVELDGRMDLKFAPDGRFLRIDD